MTAFEPEANGHLVEGLDFHKFYFALAATDAKAPISVSPMSHMCSPKVTLMAGGQSAICTYIRLIQKPGTPLSAPPSAKSKKPQRAQGGGWFNPAPGGFEDEEASAPASVLCGPPSTHSYEETRVWERQPAGNWLCMHFHRSDA